MLISFANTRLLSARSSSTSTVSFLLKISLGDRNASLVAEQTYVNGDDTLVACFKTASSSRMVDFKVSSTPLKKSTFPLRKCHSTFSNCGTSNLLCKGASFLLTRFDMASISVQTLLHSSTIFMLVSKASSRKRFAFEPRSRARLRSLSTTLKSAMSLAIYVTSYTNNYFSKDESRESIC